MTIDLKKWNGRPKNPEHDGFHVLNSLLMDSHAVARWDAVSHTWDFTGDEESYGPSIVASNHEYLGVVTMPSEIEAERVRLLARVAELEGALKPFADAASVKLCGEFSDKDRFGQTDITFHLSFGDLRRARAALGPTT